MLRVSMLVVLVVSFLSEASAQGYDLLVDNFSGGAVLRFDVDTGDALGGLEGNAIPNPSGLAVDDKGVLYVGLFTQNTIGRYNAQTGSMLDLFPTGPELDGTWALGFGPDGLLYVGSFNNGSIVRYDTQTEQLVDVFVSGLQSPRGFDFGPEGNLYVTEDGPVPGVGRFDGQTGAFLGTLFATDGAPTDLVIRDGLVYVSVALPTSAVLRHDALTGLSAGVFTVGGTLIIPGGLDFGPDGDLYLAASILGNVLRFDGTTGVFQEEFATGQLGPVFLQFVQQSECFLVIGDGLESAPFSTSTHTWTTQVGAVQEHLPVLLDDVPEFVLPGPHSLIGCAGLLGGRAPEAPAASFMDTGEFTVQVVMWSPQQAPGQPEQLSHGLAVRVAPDGSVVTRRYGQGTGMEVWAELGTNETGQEVVRFPFSIPGF